ncbi:GH25 family lysozyme [Actinocrinis sp.]|uniref:GH25 family lysozyme n=1 Tax=Actinocrinis sp. TaxID=1920516 RepID=UPI0032C2347B
MLMAGALAAGLALTAAGPAAAAPATAQLPQGSEIPLGDGYMGVGYLKDAKDFKPDTRHVLISPDMVTPMAFTGGPVGIDVSHYQGTINWSAVKAAGISFAYIKDTEGTTYKDPTFNANYLNAYKAKVIRGAYHFAQPGSSSGATQANYFASNGGAWSADNLTLPGMVDLEGGCYGLSASAMDSWILDFYNTYKARTTRDVVIYTSPSWWNTCTGGWSGMSARSPLFVADWTTAANPTIPAGFPFATLWQYTDAGSVSGISGAVDRDRFNGDSARLLALANNT